MKTKLGLLLVMLSLAVWCDDSTDAEQPTDPKVVYKQPPSENQPESTVTDWTNRRFNRAVAAATKAQQRSDDRSQWLLDNPKNPDPYKQRPATGEPEPKSAQATVNSLPRSLQRGLVAYYPFNGNAKDESGNGHDGIVRGASLTTDRFGTDNSDYSFDGTDDWIELGNVVSRYDVITMSAWVKPVDLGDKRPRTVIGKPRQSGFGGAGLRCASGTFHAGFNNHPVNVAASGENSYTDGEWHLATHVNDGSTVSLYVDGILAAEAPYVSGEATSDQIMSIGKEFLVDANDGFGLRWFHGDLDDVRIYNRALSAAEVKSLYKYESKPPVKTGNNLLRKLAHFLRL